MIVARTTNNVIGRDGDMPWRLSDDLKRFKALTSGKPVVMGRTTWESLPRKPLPNRPNIVISRNTSFSADGATHAASVELALSFAEAKAASLGMEEYFVIGGAQIYAEALPFADRLYLTDVLTELEGDTFFPDLDETEWETLETSDISADDKNDYPTRYRVLKRR